MKFPKYYQICNLRALPTCWSNLSNCKNGSLPRSKPFNALFYVNLTNNVYFNLTKSSFLNITQVKGFIQLVMIKLFNFENNNLNCPNSFPQLCANGLPIAKESFEEFSSDYVIDVFPVQTLRNFFVSVSNQLNLRSPLMEAKNILEEKPSIHSSTLYLLWPRPLSFSSYGITREEASRNVAKNVLYWLNCNTYMDKNHKPILDGTKIPNVNSIQKLSFSTDASKVTSEKKEGLETSSDTEQYKAIKSLFPHPKGVLHSCFTLLSKELKQRELNLSPAYKTVKLSKRRSLWECTYNLKWPESKKFSATGASKQDASHKAASEVLTWLYENEKINANGQPNIFKSGEVPHLKKKITELKLSVNAYNNMINILETMKNAEVRTICENVISTSQKQTLNVAEGWVESDLSPKKYKSLEFYTAKEPTSLPISEYKESLIRLLKDNSVIIVKGEPGCGKSTRVPQYVLEAWGRENADQSKALCKIVVTQPRRIAAVALAERVAYERGENVGSTVGYNIRFNNNFNPKTGYIMYCTSGILLNSLQSNPALSDCSHVILDEAHERDVNVDLLMDLVRNALILNPRLKLLVMSATMDAQMFSKYFNDAPILEIPGFTYRIDEYFLTDKSLETYNMCLSEFPQVIPKDVVNCIKYIHQNKSEGAILCFLPGWEDIIKVKELIPQKGDLVTLCLHSRLELAEQKKIFSKPPPGVRKIILATNIAETSVTIDDVVYVIDTGIHKEERLDVQKGVMCVDNHWISKASAMQRRGRAGRCQPGECYHFYPESHYKTLSEYSIPEILRTSLTKIVLDSKVYSNNMNAVQFLQQLICPPDTNVVESAVQELKELELLDENENLTPLGRTLSKFQLHPKLGKALVNSVIFKCVIPIVDIVTLYSDDTALFTNDLVDRATITQNLRKQSKTSDHLAMMQLFEKWLYYNESQNYSTATRMCTDLGLVQAKLFTLQKLRNVHLEYLHKGLCDVLPISDDFSDDYELVKGVLLSGVGNILRRRDWDVIKGRLKKSTVLLTRHNQRATITSSSVNAIDKKSPPILLMYINETISNLRRTSIIRETSVVSPLTVLFFGVGEIEIEDQNEEEVENRVENHQVVVKLGKSGIEFLCDKRHAVAIKECKEVLEMYKKYYIYQLTTGNDYNLVINNTWKTVLKNLTAILNEGV